MACRSTLWYAKLDDSPGSQTLTCLVEKGNVDQDGWVKNSATHLIKENKPYDNSANLYKPWSFLLFSSYYMSRPSLEQKSVCASVCIPAPQCLPFDGASNCVRAWI